MKATSEKKTRRRFGPLTLLLAAAVGTGAAWGERSVFGPSENVELSQAQLAEARKEAESKIPRLSPGAEARLQAASYPQLPPVSTAIDPSVDREGVSGTRTQGGAPGLPSSLGPRAAPPPATPPVPDYAERFTAWRAECQAALAAKPQRPCPRRTRILLLSELTPVGRFGRKGREGAWFRSSADKSEFFAQAGAQFYDAELVGLSPDGPVFRLKNGTTRTVKYAAERSDPSTVLPSASPTPPDTARTSPDE